MPWSKVDGSTTDACNDDQIAVVKDSDGEVEGCHETEEEANEQIAALEASESDRAMPDAQHRSVLPDATLRMSSDNKRTTVQFMTEDVARDGLVLDADGLDVTAYRDNPVVLWQHGMDPRRGAQPIARTVDLTRNDDGYLATVEWYDDDFSQQIKRQVKEGFLNAVSVGWCTEDMDRGGDTPRVTESDMTEFSFVGVPADAGALVQQRDDQSDALQLLRDLRADVQRLQRQVSHMSRGESLAATLDAAIDEMANEYENRAHSRCGCESNESRAEATASSPSDVSSEQAKAGSDATDDRDETPRPSPREATKDDYQRLANQLVPLIHTTVQRKLGKA
jgi:HK97 family phage prohead protease